MNGRTSGKLTVKPTWLHEVPEREEVINTVLAVVCVMYFSFEVLSNVLLNRAELERRKRFIDNGLGTKLTELKDPGYFSNDSISEGIHKLGVNCFENSFFTSRISGRMLVPASIQAIGLLFLTVLVALYADRQVLSAVLQLALPCTIVHQLVRLTMLHFQVKHIYNEFRRIYHNSQYQTRDSLVVSNIIFYESTLAWASVRLDSKLFKKLNTELSSEWERIKKELGIS